MSFSGPADKLKIKLGLFLRNSGPACRKSLAKSLVNISTKDVWVRPVRGKGSADQRCKVVPVVPSPGILPVTLKFLVSSMDTVANLRYS